MTWIAAAPLLTSNGRSPTPELAALDDGRILAAGGALDEPVSALLDPATGTWTSTAGTMARVRREHALVTLEDGRVLAVGGGPDSGPGASCELFDPTTSTWHEAPSLARPRANVAAVFALGRVLAIGGTGEDIPRAARMVESWRPGDAAWTELAPLPTGITSPRLLVLADGSLFAAGDRSCLHGTADAEAWTVISDEMDRSDAAFAVYRDGVARLGGLQSGGYSTEWVEVWTAAAGWRRARPLRGERAGACAVTLADGTIAVLSGELVDSSLTGGELDIEYRSSGRKTRRLGSGLIGTPDDGWRLITAPEAYVSQALRVPRSKEEIIVLSGLSGVFVIRP